MPENTNITSSGSATPNLSINKKMTGIDISDYNGVIDWAKVKTNSAFTVDYAYIKSCEGINCNEKNTVTYATGAKASGIKIGYYHFASLNTDDEIKDSVEEATYFVNRLSTLPKAEMPPVLDIETNEKFIQISTGTEVKRSIAANADGSLKSGFIKKPRLTPVECLAWIKSFMAVIHKTYPTAVLYSYTPFLDTHLPAGHGLGNLPLWIAQYTSATVPKIPKGWSDYWMWQFSSKGQISGIKGNVDMNRMKTSL